MRFFLIMMSLGYCLNLSSTVRILCTAALIKQNNELRKTEYINCLERLKHYGMKPYIVESCHSIGPTFLDDHAFHVCYTGTNNPRLRNKGVNEALSLIAALEYFNFDDNDMIIKLTGRYILEPADFINTVKNNPDVDAVVKRNPDGQVFAVCFAMRCNHMKTMLNNLNFDSMERNMINLEREVGTYIDRKQLHYLKINHIGLSGRVGGSFKSYTA